MDDIEKDMYGDTAPEEAAGTTKASSAMEQDSIPQQLQQQPKEAPQQAATTQKTRPTLHLTCFHLPVILSRDASTNAWVVKWSESLIANTDSVLNKNYAKHWIGTVSPPSGASILTDADREEIDFLLKQMNCTALFLDTATISAHYLGMCKQVLWPAFHNVDLLDLSASGWGQRDVFGDEVAAANSASIVSSAATTDALVGPTAAADMGGGAPKALPSTLASITNSIQDETPDSDWDQSRLDGWLESYAAVNRLFVDVIAAHTQPGDIVWVHDYHLALLPKLLDADEHERYGSRRTKMVFFLHIPFPTSQIFRELECGEAILEGMLHADVVGFHAFDHARHFLNAGKRILGLSYESLVSTYCTFPILVEMHQIWTHTLVRRKLT